MCFSLTSWGLKLGSLRFIGLGLYDEKGISIRGLDMARSSEVVMLESYTNVLPGLSLASLESLIGKSVQKVGRSYVEDGKELLSLAKANDLALLVAGDPFVATTHLDLRLRAARMGIHVEVVNAPSIISVAPGTVGLQNYKFGKSATITFPPPNSDVPYDTLRLNRGADLHTLFFLDLRAEEQNFMSVNEGISLLRLMEQRRLAGVVSEDMLFVGLARAGGPEQLVKAGTAEELTLVDFGGPPHLLIVPGRLHFMEAEAIVAFAGAERRLAEANT